MTSHSDSPFESWWMDWSTGPEADVLDEFTLAQQAILVGILKRMWARAPTVTVGAPGYPRPCGLCPVKIESEADLDWHGLGNCVPICDRCMGSGIEPEDAAVQVATVPGETPVTRNSAPRIGSTDCGCDEAPECTHSLYWYMGYKAAKAEKQAGEDRK